MAHHSWADLARDMALNSWGYAKCKDEKEAEELLSKERHVGEAVLIQFLAIVETVIEKLAWARGMVHSSNTNRGEKPQNIKAFPNAKLGDILYCCNDVEDGIGRTVVVFKEEDTGHVMTQAEINDASYCPSPSWATNDEHETAAEALQQAAMGEVKYHQPILDRACAALQAIKDGDDLSKFFESVKDDDDEGEDE